jgi:hypothetical protein
MVDTVKPPGQKPKDPKPRSFLHVRYGTVRFYVALFIVAALLDFINAVVARLPFALPIPEHALAMEFQRQQLDIWTEMNKLLIALATVTIGAVGGFLVNLDKSNPVSPARLQRAAVSWIFCALSLYFGYLSYNEAVGMLRLGTFDTFDSRLWWPTRAQFWTFLISVILFADFVYGSIHDKPEKASQATEG